MYVGFGRFLVALAVVGVALGATFGAGVAFERSARPPAPLAASTATASAGGFGGFGGSGAGAGAFGGLGGAGAAAGGSAVIGSVDTVTPSAISVKTAAGETVTLSLSPQTSVRRLVDAAPADIHAGDQVFATRDASSAATSVQIVPPGTALGRGGGSAAGTATGTPAASGTPGGRRAQ